MNRKSLAFTILLCGIFVSAAFLLDVKSISNNTPNEQLSGNSSTREVSNGPDQRPSDWAWERRTWPVYKFDAVAFRLTMDYAQQMKTISTGRGVEQIEFAGPTNIGGRISDIEFNRQDPTIVFAGAATGGVFKSTDMGFNWEPVFDDQANLSIGDICVDPTHGDTIYVGTGEANGGHNNFPGGGLYKSVDGGDSWMLMGLENTVSIGRVLVDPSNSDRVFVAAQGSYFTPNPERGVYRSEDGGNTWTNVLFVSDSTGAIDLIIDPINPSNMMVAMWERVRRPGASHLYGPSSGLYKSTDGGDNWTYIQPSGVLPDPNNENIGRIGIALCESQPNVVYALFTDGSFYSGLFRSNDFGESWINADPDMEISNGAASFSWYFGQVRVHPDDPEVVFALDVAYMRSTNGGSSWPIIYGYGGAPNGFHVDQHALAINPLNNDYIISGNDGGLNISTDGGVDFVKVAELPITQFYEIGLDRNNPERLYGGTQDNGTNRTLNGGLNDWTRIYGGDGFYVIVDYTDPKIIYAESQNGNLGKSYDGGFEFYWATNGIDENEPRNWSTPVVMDPNENEILYYGTNHLYRTLDGAENWTSISPNLTNGYTGSRPGTISTISVSPVNTNIIWVGTSDSRVWRSLDYGASWADVSSTMPERWVSRVFADPLEENTAYACFTGLKWADPEPHIFRTIDAGASWENISSNLPDAPVNAFVVDPTDNNYLFAGTDLGAYYSGDKGQTWQYLDPNFPMVSVYDMKIHGTEHYLAIGTHARSIYKLDLTTLVGVEENGEELSSNEKIVRTYPNPFIDNTTIALALQKNSTIKIDIYDQNGRHILNLANQTMVSGDHKFKWNGKANGIDLPPAYYNCVIKINNEINTLTMIKSQ